MHITEPGVYEMDAPTYHADPVPGGSLSSSGVKLLMPPNTPARFHYDRTHPRPDNAAFDLGHAAHTEVLGIGAPTKVIPHDTWNTKVAKAKVAEARAAGLTPVKPETYDRVQDMAEAIRRHPDASRYIRPGRGKPEQALFDIDPVTGVWKRAMVDWLPELDDDGQLIIVDYKTTMDASPGACSKHLYDFGYYGQAPWYMDLASALGLSPHYEPVFIFVFQEKEPPHLVNVVQPEPAAVEWGRVRNRKALDVYRECTETDHWPGYPLGVSSAGLPRWAYYQLEDAADNGAFDTREDLEQQA